MKTGATNNLTLWAHLACLLAACIAFVACGGNGKDVPVPKPTAYPRISIAPERVYRQASDSVPLHIEINASATASATVKPDGSTWLTVEYPAYGASLFFTFTPVKADTRSDVVLNRQERMALNLNGVQHTDTIITSQGGFEAIVVKAPYALSTPVQFLADNGRNWIVSGTAFFSKPPTSQTVDSVAPIVDALNADILHSLGSLDEKN